MKVILPLDIVGTSRLTSSTITAGDSGDPALWDAACLYSVGCVVRYGIKTYVNISAGVSATTPDVAITIWSQLGYINKFAMFDTMRNSSTFTRDYTVDNGILTVVLTPGARSDSVALLGMVNVYYVSITATVSGTPVYSNVIDNIATLTEIKNRIRFDLPTSTNMVITITIKSDGNRNIECKTCVLGDAEFIGNIQRGVAIDTVNFSTIERDIYGNISFVRRKSVPKTSQKLFISSEEVTRIVSIRKILNAVPAIWCGMEDQEIIEYYDSLIILGFYRSFSIQMDNPLSATINLELEEI